MAVSLNVVPADHVFLLFSRWHVFNPDSCWERAHVPVPLYYEHTFPTGMEIVWFTQKMTQKAWNYMQMSWSIPHFSPSKLWLSLETAWGNFYTSFQTKGISVLLTSHCGKQFVTFHKNYLKRHQQLFPRRLLGGCVPAKQLEAQETSYSPEKQLSQVKRTWNRLKNELIGNKHKSRGKVMLVPLHFVHLYTNIRSTSSKEN